MPQGLSAGPPRPTGPARQQARPGLALGPVSRPRAGVDVLVQPPDGEIDQGRAVSAS